MALKGYIYLDMVNVYDSSIPSTGILDRLFYYSFIDCYIDLFI